MPLYNKDKLTCTSKMSSNQVKLMNSTSTIIRKIKSWLMSRVSTKQMYAIDTILRLVKGKNGESVVKVLIYSDVPGLLCDVMNNHNPTLIQKVISCLLELSKTKSFYDEKHALIVIETTSRTLKILMKDVSNTIVIFHGFKLLAQILKMCSSHSAVNLGQVSELVKNVLFSRIFQKIHLNALHLLISVMRVKEPKNQEALPLLCHALHLLSLLEKNNKRKLNKNTNLVNDVVAFSLRMVSTNTSHSLSKKSQDLAWTLVCSSVDLLIEKVHNKKCHAGFAVKQICFLVHVFEYLDSKKVTRLANLLAAKGFLTMLPVINSRYKEKASELSDCVMSLVAQIIAILANMTLNVSPLANKLISGGLLCLTADTTKWPMLLGKRVESKVHYAVIFYLYFVLLCAKRCDSASTYFPFLCTFIKSQTSPPEPVLLKAIWFIFAVSSLSNQDGGKQNKKNVESANGILICWLQNVHLSSVYTHHPALLFWTFNGFVKSKILQINLMSLWLRAADKPSMNEMQDLTLKNRKAINCVLDVLIDCPTKTLSQAMTILKTVLNRDKSQGFPETSHRIWHHLPSTLSLLTTPHQENKVNNVSCVVFLACMVVPTSPDIILLLRISYQLLILLRRPIKDQSLSTVLHSQLFKLANILVIKMDQAKDYRVAESFLQDKVLLRALLSSLNSEMNIVIRPAIKLISYLQYYQRLYGIKANSCMYVSGATLLQLMSSGQAQDKLATLNLFTLLHTARNLRPVVALSTETAGHILQALYLDFQMMTLTTNESWICQTLLLQFCEVHDRQVELHLLNQPCTSLIIQLALSRKSFNSQEVLGFLAEWLGRLLSRGVVPSERSARALRRDRLTNTLTAVAMEVLRLYHPDNNLTSLHVDIASKITQIGGNVPQQVIQALEDKILINHIIW